MKTALTHFFDFFLPRICPGCIKKLSVGEEMICAECLNSILIADEDRLKFEYDKNFGSTKVINDYYAKFVFETDKTLQHIIHSLKYKKQFKIGIFLGKILASGIKSKNWQVDMIVPVPIHHLKKVERGFNQSDYIASGLSTVLNVPSYGNILKRVRHTDSQTKLNMNQRALNVADAFNVKKAKLIKDKNILLVDDVCTTGATLLECGAALRMNGARSIYASSIAIAE